MIVIIDNYDSFTHNLYQSVAPYHPEIQVIRNDKISVNDVMNLQPQGIVISPGPKRPEDAGICIDLIRANTTIPLLGVCLGHQAITMAFGGFVVSAPEIIHGKADQVSHHGQGIYAGLSMPLVVGRYHSLIAERASLPEVLQIEAENAGGLIMGLKHKNLPIYGVQFHPESILTPEGSRLIENFVSLTDVT